MPRQESEEFNVVGLARSPVKRTPRGYAPVPAGDSGLSGATTSRMSTEGSVRSVGSSAPASSEDRRRRKVFRSLAGNTMFDNSVLSSSSAARTPCSASPLDTMLSTISSTKKAVEARRSTLPVSRTLKLSPAVETTRQHQQESVMAEARTAAEVGGSMPYSEAAGDHTHRSMTQSALFSALDRLPSTPHPGVTPSNQGQLSTPPAALGETDFLGSGDISNIDEGRSGAWSDDCSFANAVFSPDPATPRVARGDSAGRGASASGEQAPATEASPIGREGGRSPPAAEIAMRATSSMNITNGHPSCTTASACTPAAVSALMRMGGHFVGTAPTPESVAADASRYRGYVAHSPIATSGSTSKECDEGGGAVGVPNTPAVAATLAAMMMGASGSVGASGKGTAASERVNEEEEEEEDEDVRGLGGEDTMKGEDEKSAPMGVQVQQPTPETPSRRDNMSAKLSIITPRRRKAASQLLDLSKATPKTMIRGILGGGNALPAQAGKQRQQRKQHTRFVPQVTKLVENVEEETPRTLLKGVCAQEDPLEFASSRTQCNSTSVAEAAAAAAAAAAATSSAAAAAVAESARAVGERAKGSGAGDASGALPHPTAQPPRVASSPPATVLAVRSGFSAKGAGKVFLKIVLVLILLVLLLGGALILAERAVVVFCLAFAGPTLSQPIY